jgi:hypothetical protein
MQTFQQIYLSLGTRVIRSAYLTEIKEEVDAVAEAEKPKAKEIKDYFKKIYPKSSDSDLNTITDVFIDSHRKKMYIANKFPELKFDEIELLSELITDKDIEEYEKELGN